MRGSKIFLCFCLAFLTGIAIASFIAIPFWGFLTLFILAGAFLGFFLIDKKAAIFGFWLLALALGLWRYQLYEEESRRSVLSIYNNDTRYQVTLKGTIIKEPDIRDSTTKITILVEEAMVGEVIFPQVKEKVLVTTWRYPEYEYGQKLKLTGTLERPPVFEEFNYKDYLARQGIHALMNWPEITLLEPENYESSVITVIYKKILAFKNKARQVINMNLSPPQSSILAAMILGDKHRLSEELQEKLNITGLRHITAISGMHITILGMVLLRIFLGLGLWRHHALYLSMAILIFYIVLIGFPASAIRAGIMAGLLMVAHSLGRISFSERTIVFAAVLMLAVNPFLLRYDIGFQLSFAAALGIIYWADHLEKWLEKVKIPKKMRGILAMTFSAQLATLPLLVYNFGQFSLVSLFTNILVVPLLPFIIGGGLVLIMAGLLWSVFGWVVSWLIWLFLSYLVLVIEIFASFPFSAITWQISFWWLVLAYVFLALSTWQLNKKFKRAVINF